MASQAPSRPRARLDAAGVDLRRALLPQVAVLGERYDAWVHTSVPPETAARLRADTALGADTADGGKTTVGGKSTAKWAGSLRIFESDWLEAHSHIHWQLVLALWSPICVALFAGAVLGLDVGFGAACAWAGFGAFLWTFLEYVLHRFVFHYKPRSAFGRKLHFLAHGIHHLDPWDGTRLVFPPVPGLLIGALILASLRSALPWGPALATMAGIVAGYLAYDMTHYYTHHAKPRWRWGRFLKRYHLAHHHKAPEAMFGVSQPLWDVVFRTGEPR